MIIKQHLAVQRKHAMGPQYTQWGALNPSESHDPPHL